MSEVTVSKTAGKGGAATAAVAAATALACGVCCVLPFALPPAVLAIGGGTIAWLGGIMPEASIAAIVAVTSAWAWVIVQSVRSGKRMALSTVMTLIGATVLLGAALGWPLLEGHVLLLFRGSN